MNEPMPVPVRVIVDRQPRPVVIRTSAVYQSKPYGRRGNVILYQGNPVADSNLDNESQTTIIPEPSNSAAAILWQARWKARDAIEALCNSIKVIRWQEESFFDTHAKIMIAFRTHHEVMDADTLSVLMGTMLNLKHLGPSDHKALIESFINRCVQYNLHTKTFEHGQTLLLALYRSNISDPSKVHFRADAAEQLVKHLTTEQINAQDDMGDTALLYALRDAQDHQKFYKMENVKIDVIRFLTKKGALFTLIEDKLKADISSLIPCVVFLAHVTREIIMQKESLSHPDDPFNPDLYEGIIKWVLTYFIQYEQPADVLFNFFLKVQHLEMIQLFLEHLPYTLSQKTLDSIISSQNHAFFEENKDLVILMLKNTNVSLSKKPREDNDYFSPCFTLAINITDPIVGTAVERFLDSKQVQDQNAVNSVFRSSTNGSGVHYYPQLDELMQAKNDTVAVLFLKHWISQKEIEGTDQQNSLTASLLFILESARNQRHTKVIAYLCAKYTVALVDVNTPRCGRTLLFSILEEQLLNRNQINADKAIDLLDAGALCTPRECLITDTQRVRMGAVNYEQLSIGILNLYNDLVRPMHPAAVMPALLEVFNGARSICELVASYRYVAPGPLEIEIRDNNSPRVPTIRHTA